jgi:DNA integrity scanning protein DisA with diadenylate cyclase activity
METPPNRYNMDIISIISIAIVVVVVYYLVKLIPSLIKVVVSIIALFIILYLLKYFFGIQLFDILIKYLNPSKWRSDLSGIVGLINNYAGLAESFLRSIISNVPTLANPQ